MAPEDRADLIQARDQMKLLLNRVAAPMMAPRSPALSTKLKAMIAEINELLAEDSTHA